MTVCLGKTSLLACLEDRRTPVLKRGGRLQRLADGSDCLQSDLLAASCNPRELRSGEVWVRPYWRLYFWSKAKGVVVLMVVLVEDQVALLDSSWAFCARWHVAAEKSTSSLKLINEEIEVVDIHICQAELFSPVVSVNGQPWQVSATFRALSGDEGMKMRSKRLKIDRERRRRDTTGKQQTNGRKGWMKDRPTPVAWLWCSFEPAKVDLWCIFWSLRKSSLAPFVETGFFITSPFVGSLFVPFWWRCQETWFRMCVLVSVFHSVVLRKEDHNQLWEVACLEKTRSHILENHTRTTTLLLERDSQLCCRAWMRFAWDLFIFGFFFKPL